jgi:hypothetical protein
LITVRGERRRPCRSAKLPQRDRSPVFPFCGSGGGDPSHCLPDGLLDHALGEGRKIVFFA